MLIALSVEQFSQRPRNDVDGIRALPITHGDDLRRFAGCFPTGVAVVTTKDGEGRAHGVTMNALTSLSLDPPLYLMCFQKHSQTLTAILKNSDRSFCINFLSAHQEEVAYAFASRARDGSASVKYALCETGAPIIDGVTAACEGRLVSTYSGGDHTIAVGQIDRVHLTERSPLVFHRGRYARLHSSPVRDFLGEIEF